MIIKVTEENLKDAARIHSLSWRESHKDFCTPEFVALHDVAHQMEYLRNEITAGKEIYMLITDIPVGIVSIKDSLIENLYVLPDQQKKGYGTELLTFAIEKCTAVPSLWILSNNLAAKKLYKKHGFILTGKEKHLTDTLSELEMEKRI